MQETTTGDVANEDNLFATIYLRHACEIKLWSYHARIRAGTGFLVTKLEVLLRATVVQIPIWPLEQQKYPFLQQLVWEEHSSVNIKMHVLCNSTVQLKMLTLFE